LLSLITRNVSAASRKKLIDIAETNARNRTAEDEKSGIAEGEAFKAAQARPRASLLTAVGKHPDGKALRSELEQAQTEIERILKSHAKNRDALRNEIAPILKHMDELERRHASLLAETEHVINRERYVPAIVKAVAKHGRMKLRERRFGGVKLRFEPHPFPPLRTSPQTSFVIEPPFDKDAHITEHFSALVGAAIADLDDGTGDVFATAGAADAGYQMARAQVGAFLTIPSGFSTLTVQARITSIDALVFAFAVGASWASSGGIAELTAIGTNDLIRREDGINYVVAPLIFYASDEITGTHVLSAQFPISQDGGDFMLNAGLKCDTWAAALAGSGASVRGIVSKIPVHIK